MGSVEVTEGRRGEEIPTSLTCTLVLMMSCYSFPDLWLFTCSDLPRLLVYLAEERNAYCAERSSAIAFQPAIKTLET